MSLTKEEELEINHILDLDDDHEWWHSSSAEHIKMAYDNLIKIGFEEDNAAGVVQTVYYATRNEYGD